MNKYFKIIDHRLPAWQCNKIFIMHKWSGLDTMYSCKINNKEYSFHINQIKEYFPQDFVEVLCYRFNENIIGYFDDINEIFFPINNDIYFNLNIIYPDIENCQFEIQIRKEKIDNQYITYQRIGEGFDKRTIQRIKL